MDISVQAKKNDQRNEAIQARERLGSDERNSYSLAIAEKLMAHPAYVEANIIFSFRPFRKEVDVDIINGLAEQAGKAVAYPICYNDGIMVAAIPEGGNAWMIDNFGIRSPIEKRSHIIDPADIDLVITPCAAYDPDTMMRIGWGAGYYDRFLPKCVNAFKVAVAYSVQRVDQLCYDQKWDAPLDAIAVEDAWYEKSE